MAPWILSENSIAKAALISLIACFYAGCIVISNHLLFPWAEEEAFRYWLHPAAGARLLLIMLFGFPAVISVGVGSAAIYISPIVPQVTEYGPALLLGFSEALGIYLALSIYGHITKIKFPWVGLRWQQIPIISICTNFGAALALNICRIFLEISNAKDFDRDVSVTLMGDILGSILFLVMLYFVRKSYLKYSKS